MLNVQALTKIYANTSDTIAGGVRDASFSLEPGTFFTLLGPSGCGKTTTLRCLAGLEQPDEGSITIGDQTMFDSATNTNVPVNYRGVGMVFQSYAIWPHMTVAENVAFPLTVAKDRKYSKHEISDAVTNALRTVSMEGFESRPATHLSGGQQQRIALARAISRTPELLLLDEPLSNLDAQLREEMRIELKRLQRQIGITTVYVTHDQAEALTLSDTIAVLDQGRIVQTGDPRSIYFAPANDFVARFVGTTNLLEGTVKNLDSSHAVIEVDGTGCLKCAINSPAIAGNLNVDSPACVSIRPEVIRLTTADSVHPQDTNVMQGSVQNVAFMGESCRVDVDTACGIFQVRTAPDFTSAGDTKVQLLFDVHDTIAVPKTSTQ